MTETAETCQFPNCKKLLPKTTRHIYCQEHRGIKCRACGKKFKPDMKTQHGYRCKDCRKRIADDGTSIPTDIFDRAWQAVGEK